MNIRAYIGCIGSGKDYRCKNECTHKVSFADGVREDVWKILGWKPKTSEEYENFKQSLYCPVNFSNHRTSAEFPTEITGRTILQNYAELQKVLHSPNYWIYRTLDALENLHKHRTEDMTVGITDCRFSNEISALIQFANDLDCDLEFVHCDYESNKYDKTSNHKSEMLAQKFAGRTFIPKEFNELIHKLYEST